MYVHNINPVMIEIFGLRIHYYGLMYAILFLSSYFLGRWYFRRFKLNPDHVDTILLISVLCTVIGARLGHVFFYSWPYFSKHLVEILYVWKGGLASHGAAIALVFGVWLSMRITKLPFWRIGDLTCLGGSLAVILVRIGNFINGEIVGRVTDVPWAVKFPCNGLVRGQCGEAFRHPVQLYESLSGVVIFGVMMWVLKKKKDVKPGLLSGIFFLGYFGSRFVIEFFKEYSGTLILEPLTNGQVLSLPMAIAGAWIIWKKRG